MSDTAEFLPYGRQLIEDDDVQAVVAALKSDFLTTGPRVVEFEKKLAAKVGAREAVAVATGTAALHAAYFAAGVGPDDEVIVPAITFLATANAARFLGATVVFSDVDPDTGLMTPETLAPKLGPRTKLVVPVHLTGAPADLAELGALAQTRGALVVDDAAHALGATYGGAPVGSCRHSSMSALSFHPVKHVTTGEGGAVTTNDEAFASRMREFRSHGMVHDPARLEREAVAPGYYEQHSLGFNYRITDIQCALGSSQLAKLDRFIARRRALARRYTELLANAPGVRPVTGGRAAEVSAFHLYAVLVDFPSFGMKRFDVMQRLRSRGIGTQIHYPPVPGQPYYQRLGEDGKRYPGAERYFERTLSLPMFPAMKDSDVDRVVTELRGALLKP